MQNISQVGHMAEKRGDHAVLAVNLDNFCDWWDQVESNAEVVESFHCTWTYLTLGVTIWLPDLSEGSTGV